MAEEKFTKVLNPYVAEAKIAPVSGRPIDFAPKYAAPAFVTISGILKLNFTSDKLNFIRLSLYSLMTSAHAISI